MGISSKESEFSSDQAITADADSTNYIDLGAPGTPHGAAAALSRDIAYGEPVPIEVIVTEVFDNLTSLNINVEMDDNTSFSSGTVVYTENFLLADLVVGANLATLYVPAGITERYVQLQYDVVGTNPSTGQLTAYIGGGGRQTNS